MKKISRKSFLKLAAATTAGAAMTPALMGCGWPSAQDLAPYQGDIVLLLSNDIHSNLGTSKIMSTDGSTRITAAWREWPLPRPRCGGEPLAKP